MFGFGKRSILPGDQPDIRPPLVSRGGGLGDLLGIVGATMVDMDNPGAGALQNRQRMKILEREEAEKRQRAAQIQSAIAGMGGNVTREGLMGILAPALIEQGNYGGLAGLLPDEPERPTRLNTKDGVVEIGPDGTAKLLYGVTKDEPKPNIPFGWTVGPDGLPQFQRGGPFDPSYIGQASGARAGAVAAHRAPRVGRSSGGRSGGAPAAKLPSGFILD